MAQDDVIDSSDQEHVFGTVKWFDPTKGFGFIVSDSGGPDILLHANVLRNFGQSSIADGSHVEIMAHSTGRGVQALEVLAIEPPELDHDTTLDELSNLDQDGALTPLLPARVKWFDKGKGFGFANIFGRSDDVFVHVEVLRRSGLADLQPGEAIGVRITDGQRGIMATEVTSWDAASTQD